MKKKKKKNLSPKQRCQGEGAIFKLIKADVYN